MPETLITALEDDLNTPKALAALEELAKPETAGELKAGANFMGLLTASAADWFQSADGDKISADEVEKLIAERIDARKSDDFSKADDIRDNLTSQGIILEDSATGTGWRRAD